MQRLSNFSQQGVIVSITDSITRRGGMRTWVGSTKRLWVKPSYIEYQGEPMPAMTDPIEIYLLDDDEPDPPPQSGWCYALGFWEQK
jgi:hypothetical protein